MCLRESRHLRETLTIMRTYNLHRECLDSKKAGSTSQSIKVVECIRIST